MSTRLTRKDAQARTRQRLIAAASTAFREHGFHRSSAEAIAADAGYTRGALYANFDGKEGLFLAVLDEEIGARYDVFAGGGAPAGFARRYEALLDADPGWTLALLEFTIHAARRPELAAELQRRNREIRELISAVITQSSPDIDRGDAEAGARLVVAANTGVALERALDRDAAGAPELRRAYDAALREI